jgi:hypothetical protein
MKKILLGIVIGAFALSAWQRVNHPDSSAPTGHPVADPELVERPTTAAAAKDFHCDGRVQCSEMKSCDEAEFFVENCPGVKMDGDGDGKPCEDWCGH